MRQTVGNLWEFHKNGAWVVITTNGVVNQHGACIMGKGIALDAKQRFRQLPFELGRKINLAGNHAFAFPQYRIITLPTKHHYRDVSSIALIRRGVAELVTIANTLGDASIYMVAPGCGSGHLDWSEVEPVISPVLDDRFVVVNLE